MAENKFIERLHGKETTKAVLEIKNADSKTSFAKMPQGTSDATFVYSDSNHDATAVLKNATNWKVIGSYLDLTNDVACDGDDYTGESVVSGISDEQGNNLWINSSYTVPADGMVFTKNTKWVLKLCGDNLLENGGSFIDFTVIIVLGSSNIISKTFTVKEQASFFCKEMVIDFAESNNSVIKLEPTDTITLKLLSNSANASARIYQGMTTLTALQRRVDSDTVASNTRTLDDIENDVDYLQDHIIVKSSTMPTASASLIGQVYQYTGITTYPYEHGFIYECVESVPGVYSWQRIDVQPGGSRGRFLSLWNCATGLAVTNPPISPYEYKTGDYFIVSNVSSGTNYKPSGTEYVIGTASTVVETSDVFVDDTYFFDGTTWKLQSTSNNIKSLLDTKVNIDGTSVMTGPLKIRAGSMQGAIAAYWDGVGFFKLNSDDSVTLLASMEETDGLCPAANNTYNIGKTNYKWKDLYLGGTAYISTINNGVNLTVPTPASADTLAVLGDIAFKSTDVELTSPVSGQFLTYDGTKWVNSTHNYANTDLSNLTSTGQNISNWSSNVSNCITNIPQDIKLEFNNNTLTLKAGSKVYVPNGVNNFDVINIESDISRDFYGSSTVQVYLITDTLGLAGASNVVSGTTVPSSGSGLFYNLTTNIIKTYTNGTEGTQVYSFPLCVITMESNQITSIDQVFNGFGYIGSTVFALPGVKGLIPNGRNADGTLKNTAVTISSVQTVTNASNLTLNLWYVIRSNGAIENSLTDYWTYDTQKNLWVHDNAVFHACVFAESKATNGQISGFNSKPVFHAVDYSDTGFIAHQAMPSNRSIDLTLPASGGSIIAPADGYLYLAKTSSASGQRVKFKNTSAANMAVSTWSSGAQNLEIIMPVSKNNVVAIYYSADGVTNQFRFIYANGAQ